MQLGFVTAIFPDLDLDGVLAVAAREGFACVEPMCWPPGGAERRYAGVSHIDVEGFDAADAERVKALCEKHGVALSALGYYPNPLAADPGEAAAAVAHLRKVISAAGLLGVATVNTFIGRDHTRSMEDNWERLDGVWPNLLEHAGVCGVRVAIENCPMRFTADEWPGGKNLAVSPAVWEELFRRLPSPHLGLNYDPSHLVWQMMDPVAPVREFAPRLFHIHAKDAALDRPALDRCGIHAHPLAFHRPVLPGLGDVDWTAFIGALKGVGYAGPVCIEVEDRAYEGSFEDRVRALQESRQHLAPLISGA